MISTPVLTIVLPDGRTEYRTSVTARAWEMVIRRCGEELVVEQVDTTMPVESP